MVIFHSYVSLPEGNDNRSVNLFQSRPLFSDKPRHRTAWILTGVHLFFWRPNRIHAFLAT